MRNAAFADQPGAVDVVAEAPVVGEELLGTGDPGADLVGALLEVVDAPEVGHRDAPAVDGELGVVAGEAAQPAGLGRRREQHEVRAWPVGAEHGRRQRHGVAGVLQLRLVLGDPLGQRVELVVELRRQPVRPRVGDGRGQLVERAVDVGERLPERGHGGEVDRAAVDLQLLRVDLAQRGGDLGGGVRACVAQLDRGVPVLRRHRDDRRRRPPTGSEALLGSVQRRRRRFELVGGERELAVAEQVDAALGGVLTLARSARACDAASPNPARPGTRPGRRRPR